MAMTVVLALIWAMILSVTFVPAACGPILSHGEVKETESRWMIFGLKHQI